MTMQTNPKQSQSIYLDVSSTAVSPTLTGIPRVVRALANHRTEGEVHLIEFDGLANSYKLIQELPSLHTASISPPRQRRALIATKLYKVLTENRSVGNIVTFLLRNRFIFYGARRLLGTPSAKGEVLNTPEGILFLPEVPVHNRHVQKIVELKRSGSIRLALFVHDVLPLQHPKYFSRDLVWKFNNFLPLIEVADLILVSNEDVQNQVKEIFQKTQVLIAALPSSYPPTLLTSEPKSSFLVVGTMEPRKNYMAILDSFEKLHALHPHVELRIVGNLGWNYTDIVVRISNLQRLGAKLTWLQNLKDEELRREYQQTIALLYPSHFEGYGLPVVEALSQSTPVITSNRASMRLFEKFGGVTLIDPEAHDELFKQMLKMLNPEYRQLQSQQIKLDEVPSSWQVFARQCYNAIKEV